ncbi:hypothetical protein [Haliscomenobacter sp.]|uniref:hypothetical protein n=1 Tax=Haliscomenobacter sp. TaxID=2717303 RepID=UPI003593791F
MKKTLERLNGEKFASYALEAKAMFSIVGATDLTDGPTGTQTGGSTNKLVASTCNLGFSHANKDWASDQTPIDLDPIKDVDVK